MAWSASLHTDFSQLRLLRLVEQFDRLGGYVIDQSAFQPTDEAILALAHKGFVECHQRHTCGTSRRMYRLRVTLTDKGRWHLHAHLRDAGIVTH
jgi:hypothetical protein